MNEKFVIRIIPGGEEKAGTSASLYAFAIASLAP